MKVLIADDSRSMREMLKGTLEQVGYDVVVTEDGRQAWEALSKGDLHLAILDWLMPHLDGVEVCRKLRDERMIKLVHVILLTSREGSENVVAALQAGASDYICKPFHPDELLARLKVGERNVNLQIQLSHTQKMEAVGRLAAGIAHEINTPLQYIRDNTSFLSEAFRDVVKLVPQQYCLTEGGKLLGGSEGEINETSAEAAGEEEEDVKNLIQDIPEAIRDSLEGLDRITEIVRAMKEFSSSGAQKKEAIDINKAIANTITVSRN